MENWHLKASSGSFDSLVALISKKVFYSEVITEDQGSGIWLVGTKGKGLSDSFRIVKAKNRYRLEILL